MMLTLAHLGGRAGGFFFGPLLFLLFVGLMTYLIIRLVRRQGPWMQSAGAGLGVLEERYAKGEIDREEYLAKREDLTPPRRSDKKK